MAKVCEICSKKQMTGNQVSHSHRASKKAWQPNLQKIRFMKDGKPTRGYVCTRCIRSGKVEKI